MSVLEECRDVLAGESALSTISSSYIFHNLELTTNTESDRKH